MVKTEKIIAKFGGIGLAVLALLIAGKHYLGYHYFYEYKEVRGAARSIEMSFPELETNLKKAVRFSKNPLFYKEIARLYLEMALAANEFGTPEKRDFYLDQAKKSLSQVIGQNPIDAFAYFEMGKVYLLYNYPLLTYMDKGKVYFRKALELKSADEFLNLNILYIYLTQWDFMEEAEKNFVLARLQAIGGKNKNFMARLRDLWQENFGSTIKLDEILQASGLTL